MEQRKYQICTNCVMDTSDPEIKFDENGRCDFCDNFYNTILPNWHPDETGKRELEAIVQKIKEHGRGRKYDCIIGVSGGVDSSYLLYYSKAVLGLNPLAFTVDNGWNLNVAVENIEKLVRKLGIDLYTEVVDWNEMKDLQVAFLKSQVPYQDLPQDQAIFAGLYNYAAKHGFKYILTGANYSMEGVKPPYEWTYLSDLRMLKDIHRKFGKGKLKTYPLCGMFRKRFYYRYIRGMKEIHPLNMIPYEKEDAIRTLKEKYDWEKYENKHYENIFTRFYEGYWLPKKFGYDKRRIYLSNMVLTGQMTREQALEELSRSPYSEKDALEDLEYVAKKLSIKREDIIDLMEGEKKTFKDYKNSAWLLKGFIRTAKLFGIEKRNFR